MGKMAGEVNIQTMWMTYGGYLMTFVFVIKLYQMMIHGTFDLPN